LSEFSLIKRYFTRATPGAILGVGDDAALLSITSGMELAVSTDMLVSGTHFFADADPYLLGHKALAVNLSDMAAMGAQPRWATLAISLPNEEDAWLERFSAGFFALADEFKVELVGGDTTQGPLNISITILGEVPRGKALRRDAAKMGDEIWVSGVVGEAALALGYMQGKIDLSEMSFKAIAPALHQPQPRVALGQALRGLANSAIDVSDGLLADLGHILECSKLGAEIHFDKIPVSNYLRPYLAQVWGQHCALAGGDEYELCFTAPIARHAELDALSEKLKFPLTCIGNIVAGKDCKIIDANGNMMKVERAGYDHFKR